MKIIGPVLALLVGALVVAFLLRDGAEPKILGDPEGEQPSTPASPTLTGSGEAPSRDTADDDSPKQRVVEKPRTLEEDLVSADTERRRNALARLLLREDGGRAYLDLVLQSAGHAKADVRKTVESLLIRMGQTTSEDIVRAVLDDIHARGGKALTTILGTNVLPKFGSHAVPAVARAMGDAKGAFWAMTVLAEMSKSWKGVGLASAVPILIEHLRIGNEDAQYYAALSMQWVARDASPAVDDLAALLGSRAERTRRAAALSLGKIGEKAASALPALEARRDATRSEMERAAYQHAIHLIRGTFGPK